MMSYELNPLCSKVCNYSCSLELQALEINSWHGLWKLRVKPLLRQRKMEFGLWAQAWVLVTGVTGQFSKLPSDCHKVEYLVVLCQEGLKALGSKLPAEENVKVPKMPTLKNAFQHNPPKTPGKFKCCLGEITHYWWPLLTPELEHFKTRSTGWAVFQMGVEVRESGCVLSPEAWHESRIEVPWLPEHTLGSWPDPILLRNDPSHSHSFTSSPSEPSLQWGWVPMCAGPDGDDVNEWEWEGSRRERPWVVCPGRLFQEKALWKKRSVSCEIWRAFL